MTDKFGLGIKSRNFLLLKIPDFNTVTLSFSSRKQKDLNPQLGNKWWYSVKLVEVLVLPKLMSKVHTHPTHCLKPYSNQQRTVPAVVQKQHPLIPPACFTALVATRCALGFIPPTVAWPQRKHCQTIFYSKLFRATSLTAWCCAPLSPISHGSLLFFCLLYIQSTYKWIMTTFL